MTERSTSRMPVIIPAYKGRQYIDAALSALPREQFQPLVAVNGEDDGTAARATEKWGADAFIATEQGKMPAIQEALMHLGERAVQPLAIMDVDTRIRHPRAWQAAVDAALKQVGDRPLYMTGPVQFTHANPLEAAARTRWYHSRFTSNGPSMRDASAGAAPLDAHYGPNTVFHAANEATLEDVLQLDNYWPGEDRAMADVVLRHSGVFYQNRSRDMTARTPLSDSYEPMVVAGLRKVGHKLGIHADRADGGVVEHYVQRGPANARPYPAPDEHQQIDSRPPSSVY